MSNLKKYNDHYSYEILDDGYLILYDNVVIIQQISPYDKPLIPNGTYEDNAIKQIELLINPPTPTPTSEELVRGDIDYIALMEDLELPSYKEEDGE